jgi:HK97 gp10 family phage protein
MSFLVPGDSNPFKWVVDWFGAKIRKQLDKNIDDKMHDAGQAIVRRAKQLAPVETGALRDSINYLVVYNETGGNHELLIQVGEPYGIYQEFGTRNIPPHPYIRPAINEFGRVWGVDINPEFAVNAGHTGLLAGIGPLGAGFALHHKSRKPLTAKQVKHVETGLIPSIRRLNRGATKRSRLRVRVI